MILAKNHQDSTQRGKGYIARRAASVLWVYRTTTKTPIGETLFRLAYGSEAVIPTKVRLTSYKLENQNKSRNDKAIRLQLDLVDEVKAIAEHSLA